MSVLENEINESNDSGKPKSLFTRVLKSVEHKLRAVLRMHTPTLKESLEEVIEEHGTDGVEIPEEERTLLRNVLTFSELSVEDIMVPRADILFVKNDISLDELKKTIIGRPHTRIPVCRETLDDIIGFIHTKDIVAVLCGEEKFVIENIMRQAIFVPPSMKISDLLLKMRSARVHIALVVDEYGGTSGIVTMEDVVEEIVGEIEDEHDSSDGNNMMRISDGVYDASARVEIEELEEVFLHKFSNEDNKEDFDTLGGMLFSMEGRVPSKGEIIILQDRFEVEIVEADPRKIKRVLIRDLEKASS